MVKPIRLGVMEQPPSQHLRGGPHDGANDHLRKDGLTHESHDNVSGRDSRATYDKPPGDDPGPKRPFTGMPL